MGFQAESAGVRCIVTLFELYGEKPESYYGICYNPEYLFHNDDTLDETQRCKMFLNEHYMKGKKQGLLKNKLFDNYQQNGKHVHSASLYLLGKSLLPYFQEKIGQSLKEFLPHYDFWHDNGHDFLHTWYLTSMYHDYASCVERSTIQKSDSERHRTLDFYLGKHNIQFSPYEMFPFKSGNIPFRFSRQLIENYFYYRACNCDCEHGIIAGFLFFDLFVKNFLKNTSENNSGSFDENGNMIYEGLDWNTDFPMYAAYLADSIICHNIWLGGNSQKEVYDSYGLSPLLYTECPNSKLSFEKFPLQFMLCLLDTIEPVKRFSHLTARSTLENVSIWKIGNRQIGVAWNNRLKQEPEFQKWMESIYSMKNWMQVDISLCRRRGEWCDVTIDF